MLQAIFWPGNLKTLILKDIGLPLSFLIQELPSSLENLAILNCPYCLTSEVFGQHVAPKLTFGQLRSLSLGKTGFDFNKPEILEPLKVLLMANSTMLEELDLSGNCLTKQFVSVLCDQKLQLKHLVLTHMVSPDAFDFLKTIPRLAEALASK